MRKILMLLPIVLMLSGCAVIDWIRPLPIIKYETVEVKVPIYMNPRPPEVLTMPLNYDLPVFISPTTEGATSCLNGQGEVKAKRILLNLYDRDKSWRAWSE